MKYFSPIHSKALNKKKNYHTAPTQKFAKGYKQTMPRKANTTHC